MRWMRVSGRAPLHACVGFQMLPDAAPCCCLCTPACTPPPTDPPHGAPPRRRARGGRVQPGGGARHAGARAAARAAGGGHGACACGLRRHHPQAGKSAARLRGPVGAPWGAQGMGGQSCRAGRGTALRRHALTPPPFSYAGPARAARGGGGSILWPRHARAHGRPGYDWHAAGGARAPGCCWRDLRP